MRYAFSTLSCPAWSSDRVAAAAAEMGYDGVEWRLIDGEVIDPVRDASKVEQAVDQCRTRGIEVPALDTSCRFNLPDEAARAAQVEALRHWIALAGRLSIPILRVFGGQEAPGRPTAEDEANHRVADSLRAVADEAARAGVTVALETHDAFSSARRVARVLDLVDAPSVAALWDSHHPYRVGETPADVIAALGNRIAFVHVKDARRVPDGEAEWDLVLMGEGEVPVREQLTALRQHGYDGWASVEWEKKWHPDLADPETALPQHLAWLTARST